MTPRRLNESQTHDLHQESLEGFFECSGDVESPTGWFALVPEDEFHGWVLLTEDRYGFKEATEYDTEAEARKVFDSLDERYLHWNDPSQPPPWEWRNPVQVTDDRRRALTDVPEPPEGSVILVHGLSGTAYQRLYRDGMWHGMNNEMASWDEVLRKPSVWLVHVAPPEV